MHARALKRQRVPAGRAAMLQVRILPAARSTIVQLRVRICLAGRFEQVELN